MANNRKDLALKTVQNAFDTAKTARQPYENKWNEFYRILNYKKKANKTKWMTNRSIPYTASLIDLILPRLAAKRPGASVIGRDENSQLKAQKFNELLTYEQDQMGIDVIFTDWILESIGYGTGFLKVGWKKETAKNLTHTGEFIQKMKNYFAGIGFNLQEDDLLYDGPTAEHVDIFDLFVHPKARTRDDALYIIHRSELTKYDLRKNPNYKNADISELKQSNVEVDEYRKKRLMAEGLSPSQAQKIVESMADNYHEILEYWGFFDIDNDGMEEECVITVADRKTIIRLEENPYYHGKKPFVVLKYMSNPHFFYGKGVVERVQSLQEELDDASNQASDNRKLTLLPVIKVKSSANLDIDTIKIAPGVPIALDDVNDLVFERTVDFTQQLEFFMKTIREMMQIATGANDVSIGVQDTGVAAGDTLGGAQLASEQTALRFRIPALQLDMAVEDFGNFLICNNQQYVDRKRTLRIFGDQGLTYEDIMPTDLTGQFTYRSETMSMAPVSQSIRQQQLVNLKSLYPQGQIDPNNPVDRMIVEAFNVDPEKLTQPPAQASSSLQQFMQLPHEQQTAFLAQLDPTNRQIMLKAIGANNVSSPAAMGIGGPTNQAPGVATATGPTTGQTTGSWPPVPKDWW